MRAGTTVSTSALTLIALLGCQNPLSIATVPLERGGGTLEPLTVRIAGPRIVDLKGRYAWEAVLSGEGPGDRFQWEISYPGSGTRYALGTGQVQTKTVYDNDDRFDLSVTVTSASGSATATLSIAECIDACEHRSPGAS